MCGGVVLWGGGSVRVCVCECACVWRECKALLVTAQSPLHRTAGAGVV